MGLTTSMLKHILLLLNFIFAVLSLILIGVGIFILVSSADNTINHGENVAAGIIIALGVIILSISILGSLAAIHEARHRLLIYIASLSVLVLLQLLLLSMASQGTKDGLAGSIQEGFEDLWQEELKEPGALAYYEERWHCCGVNGTDDYRRIGHAIPKTCCIEGNCGSIYEEGCQSKFEDYLSDKLFVFSIVCWLLIIGEIVAAVLGWLLFSSLKNQSRRAHADWM